MQRKGFRHAFTQQDIIEYSRLSARDKLNWLEEANRFSHTMLRGKTKKIWDKFRRGEI